MLHRRTPDTTGYRTFWHSCSAFGQANMNVQQLLVRVVRSFRLHQRGLPMMQEIHEVLLHVNSHQV